MRRQKHVARFGSDEAKARGYQEYIDFVEGIIGESDEGLYSAAPYHPDGFEAIGEGNFRYFPKRVHY